MGEEKKWKSSTSERVLKSKVTDSCAEQVSLDVLKDLPQQIRGPHWTIQYRIIFGITYSKQNFGEFRVSCRVSCRVRRELSLISCLAPFSRRRQGPDTAPAWSKFMRSHTITREISI
jgi:hypothetical protein